MHGSPLSPFDNRMIWEKYDYKKLGIIGEPYIDLDYREFGYFTDTGRKWNGASIRDNVPYRIYDPIFKSTTDIIKNIDKLPSKIFVTIHPQRWTDQVYPWIYELITQNCKNVIKTHMFANRGR